MRIEKLVQYMNKEVKLKVYSERFPESRPEIKGKVRFLDIDKGYLDLLEPTTNGIQSLKFAIQVIKNIEALI